MFLVRFYSLDSRPFAGYWGFYDGLEDLGNTLPALMSSQRVRVIRYNLFCFPLTQR
jgi:hypothetical protein